MVIKDREHSGSKRKKAASASNGLTIQNGYHYEHAELSVNVAVLINEQKHMARRMEEHHEYNQRKFAEMDNKIDNMFWKFVGVLTAMLSLFAGVIITSFKLIG